MSVFSRSGISKEGRRTSAGKKPLVITRMFLVAILLGIALFVAVSVQAQDELPPDEEIVWGAILYDKWFAALGVDVPLEENPLWGRQTTNSRSGPDTWRCAECHGWDYKGVDGAYGTGSHFTGFPNIKELSERMSQQEILNHLNGKTDPAHDFSQYIPDEHLSHLASFLKFGIIDDDLYIDPISLGVIAGDIVHGKELYEDVCAECHGEEGKIIVFRSEGIDEFLGTVANRDPWRFLHRTRFGTAGTTMPVGYSLGWSPEDGRDILAYAQTFPTGIEDIHQSQASEGSEPATEFGGPAQTFWQGILTGFAAFLGTIGASILFLSVLVLIGVLVVVLLRRR